MNANNFKFLGIIFTDFAGDNLIDKVFKLNAQRFVPCPSSQIDQGCTYCDSTSKCLGCNTVNNYVYQSSNFSCKANKGYYLNWTSSSSNFPYPCNTVIKGCLQCLSSTECTLCDSVDNYQLSNNTCIAAPGYYLDSNSIPVLCTIVGCYICSSATVCTTCSANNNFIMDANNTCVCNSTALFVQYNDTCICQPGFFLNGNLCEPIPLCPLNYSGCFSCNSGPIYSCDTCDSNNSFQHASFNASYC